MFGYISEKEMSGVELSSLKDNENGCDVQSYTICYGVPLPIKNLGK